jgi:hypothetical protein
MSRIRTLFISILISGVVSAGMALVPTIAAAQSRDQTPTMTDKAKSTADDVSKWTQKQWNAANPKAMTFREVINAANNKLLGSLQFFGTGRSEYGWHWTTP